MNKISANELDPYKEGSLGDENVYILPFFTFENGQSLNNMKIAYVTHGKMNSARDNVVLMLPGTANTRHSSDGYIGAGKAFDPAQYFIICVDAIGGGGSSKPGDGLGASFPAYSVRDMVRVQYELLTRHFGLLPQNRLCAVAGPSMGAFQALEWAIQYPDALRKAVLMVPSVRGGNLLRLAAQQMIGAITIDPMWNGGHYTNPPLAGLAQAGRSYYPLTVTDTHLARMPWERLEAELEASASRFMRWDAWSLIRRYQASSQHDVGVPFAQDIDAALSRISAHLLVLPVSSDRLLGLEGARRIAKIVPRVKYREVPSELGHFGWRPIEGSAEADFISKEIKEFMCTK